MFSETTSTANLGRGDSQVFFLNLFLREKLQFHDPTGWTAYRVLRASEDVSFRIFWGEKLDFSTSGKGEKGERGADVKFCPCPFELQMLKKKKEQEEKIKQQKEEEEESRLKVSP